MLNKEVYEKAIQRETNSLRVFGKEFSQGRKFKVVMIPALIEQIDCEERIEYITNGKFIQTYNNLIRDNKE